MVPPTMAMPKPLDIAKELALSLQHVRRIREVLPLTPSPDEPALYMGLVVWATETETLPAVAAALLMAMNLNGSSQGHDSDQSKDVPPVLFVVPVALPKAAAVEVQALFQSIHEPEDDRPLLSANIITRREIGLREETSELSNGRSFTIYWFNQNGKYPMYRVGCPNPRFQLLEVYWNQYARGQTAKLNSHCEYTTPLFWMPLVCGVIETKALPLMSD
jgi:hypothetical protein